MNKALLIVCVGLKWVRLKLLFLFSPGVGGTEAEGEGGEGAAAGPAGALQKMLDSSQHSLGKGAGQQSRRPEVTPAP